MATDIPIEQIVDVNISVETAIQSELDFGLLCLMTDDILVITPVERYKIYDSLIDLEVDFNNTTDEYKAAEAYFGQNPVPTRLMVAVVDLIGGETYVDAITDAYKKQVFYALAVTDLTLIDATVQSIAEFVQTQTMLYFYQTSAADVLTNVTTDIASLLRALNLFRTVVCYNETATRMDLAYPGMGLTRVPTTVADIDRVSINWSYQTLSLVEPTSATSEEQNLAIAKGVNFYTLIGGTGLTRQGNTSGNPESFIDEIQGIDWTKVNMELAVFNLIASSPKIPYTDGGVASIEAVVMSVLRSGISLEIYAGDPAPTTSAIPVADVPAGQRLSRIAPDIHFTARLAGAINKVIINGTVSV